GEAACNYDRLQLRAHRRGEFDRVETGIQVRGGALSSLGVQRKKSRGLERGRCRNPRSPRAGRVGTNIESNREMRSARYRHPLLRFSRTIEVADIPGVV